MTCTRWIMWVQVLHCAEIDWDSFSSCGSGRWQAFLLLSPAGKQNFLSSSGEPTGPLFQLQLLSGPKASSSVATSILKFCPQSLRTTLSQLHILLTKLTLAPLLIYRTWEFPFLFSISYTSEEKIIQYFYWFAWKISSASILSDCPGFKIIAILELKAKNFDSFSLLGSHESSFLGQ